MTTRLPVIGAAPADHAWLDAAIDDPTPPPRELIDAFARRVSYLRVSLTDRCNYRCTYCMPEAGVDLLPREEIATHEELERIVTAFVSLGVTRVRLTGGEPTIRKGVVDLVARLARIPGLRDLSMTTNGEHLIDLAAPLRAAGLSRLNVSIDSLDAERFRAITRRGNLARVLAGTELAAGLGFRAVKLNAVAVRGFNDGELGALCAWAWQHGITPRFIEQMPMSGGTLFVPGEFLPAAEIRAGIEAQLGIPGERLIPEIPDDSLVHQGGGPARYYTLPSRGPAARVGIISAVTEQFCDTCNRVRLDAIGRLHACLAYDDAISLRDAVRRGAPDAAIARLIGAVLLGKRRGHEFTETGCGAPSKAMVSMGG